MPTPALKHFLDAAGRVVHHLNTIAVGLSAVESGAAQKPAEMDITWRPKDRTTSSRQARVFALEATIIFLAENVITYCDQVSTYPGVGRPSDWPDRKKAARLVTLHDRLKPAPEYLLSGTLLILHWRNRVVHDKSNATLTDAQRKSFLNASTEIAELYKNLDPILTLEHFDANGPTLKDVSSLTAMAIKYLRALDAAIPEPQTAEDVMAWLAALNLEKEFDRARRVAASQGKEQLGIKLFMQTHCPMLVGSSAML